MPKDPIPALIQRVDQQRLADALFYLAKDPLPFRKLNFTLPGHSKSTLEEADDFIQAQLEGWGYPVEKEEVAVQAFGCDPSKPKAHQYAPPPAGAPWYKASNLYAKKLGAAVPEEIIVLIAHKDSQSWVDSPGAYDNAVGTGGLLEIARLLADYENQRSIWWVFCNEEHTPWTSVTAAQNARARGDCLIAIFNLDGLGGKSQEDTDAGRKTNTTLYTTPEGHRLARLMAEVNEAYHIGLIQQSYLRQAPGDDDGSFIHAGFAAAVANIGSYPYADPNYHLESDRPEWVDLPNVRMAVQATLAAVGRLDRRGVPQGETS